MVAAWICAIAIASVPIFSYQGESSRLPQILALCAVAAAFIVFLRDFPSIHPALIAYVTLVVFWGFHFVDWLLYFSLVKVAVLAVAVHIAIRTPRQIVLLFSAYSAAGLITLIMNWAEIAEIQSAIMAGTVKSGYKRLDGSFADANTAGMYGMMVTLCAMVVFFNTRNKLRWLLLIAGVFSGVIIGAFSGSRTALLGMMAIAMATPLLAMAGDRGELLKWAKGMLLGAVALGIVVGVLSQLPHTERLFSLTGGVKSSDESANIRYDMVVAALRMWWAHPIFGVGYEGFAKYSEFGTYSHTTYGEVLACGGFIGFILISVFYVVPAWQLAWLARASTEVKMRRLSVGLLCVWLVFTVYSMFSVLHSSRDLIPICAAICGFVQEQYRGRSIRKNREITPGVREPKGNRQISAAQYHARLAG